MTDLPAIPRLLAAALLAVLLTACASREEGGDPGDIPQAQPANWEGGLPGIAPSGPPR